MYQEMDTYSFHFHVYMATVYGNMQENTKDTLAHAADEVLWILFKMEAGAFCELQNNYNTFHIPIFISKPCNQQIYQPVALLPIFISLH